MTSLYQNDQNLTGLHLAHLTYEANLRAETAAYQADVVARREKNEQITPLMMEYLLKVYLTVIGTLVATAVGVLVYRNVFQLHPYASLAGFSGCLIYFLLFTDKTGQTGKTDPTGETLRLLLLGAVGLTAGMSIGPLVTVILVVDPSILVTALVATTMVFVSFSLSAILAERRSYLYLSGTLVSAGACVVAVLIGMNRTESAGAGRVPCAPLRPACRSCPSLPARPWGRHWPTCDCTLG